MIGLRDASVLALTKLRTRRIRTIVTVAISGLLFAVLVGALTGFQGAVNSVNAFNQNGLNSRYIVSASAFPSYGQDTFKDPQIIARAAELRTQTIADKKAAAKQLKLTYDPSSEPAVTMPYEGTGGGEMLNFASTYAQQALQEYYAGIPVPGMPELKQLAAKYHASAFYTSTGASIGRGTLATMPSGQEVFPSVSGQRQQSDAVDIFASGQMMFMPSTLTNPFLLPDTTWTKASDAIPLLVPYSMATKLLGMQELSRGASADQKLERIQELNRKAGTAVVDACYRNSESVSQISTAVSVTAEIQQHAGDKKYQKPDLVQGLPAADSCGPVAVVRDVRTKAQKQTDANQGVFNRQFKLSEPAEQRKIRFQIVGLTPDPQTAPSNSATGIVQSLLGSSLAGIIVIPQNLYNQLPSAQQYNAILTAPTQSMFALSMNQYFAEFGTADSARAFINHKSCAPGPSGCPAAKPFVLNAFGSNSIGLQDVQHKFNTVLYIAAAVIVAIAIVIMTGTVGRMLADSRRETAVFRAIGANRWDIVVVYGLYTVMLSLMIVAASLLLGAIAAKIGDAHLWKTSTVHAKLAFGGADTPQAFHFYGYSVRIWLVAAAALGAGLLGMIFPLLRNLRRNPIKDMREE